MANTDLRKNLRVKEDLPVRWRIQDSPIYGEGRLKNLSTGGLSFETNAQFKPSDGCVFTFDSFPEGVKVSDSLLGRLVWSQKKGFSKSKTVCGIEFVNPTENIVAHIRERVQKRIIQSAKRRKVESFFAVLLLLFLLAFTVYSVRQYLAVYGDLSSVNNAMLATSSKQAALYRESLQQLAIVKETLAQTEMLLNQVKAENALLTKMTEEQKVKLAEDENTITQLKTQNEATINDLTEVRDKLHFYERDIKSLEDGRDLIKVFRYKIHDVKRAVHDIRRQAYYAKITALKELDKLKLLQGNNGFFVKSGKAYQSNASNEAQQAAQANRRIEVNVEIIK